MEQVVQRRRTLRRRKGLRGGSGWGRGLLGWGAACWGGGAACWGGAGGCGAISGIADAVEIVVIPPPAACISGASSSVSCTVSIRRAAQLRQPLAEPGQHGSASPGPWTRTRSRPRGWHRDRLVRHGRQPDRRRGGRSERRGAAAIAGAGAIGTVAYATPAGGAAAIAGAGAIGTVAYATPAGGAAAIGEPREVETDGQLPEDRCTTTVPRTTRMQVSQRVN